MRIYAQATDPEDLQRFRLLMHALANFDLVDVMRGLAEEVGGTTPLYAAVEQATEEIDENLHKGR